MMKQLMLLAVVVALAVNYSNARIFSECELAYELRRWPDFFTFDNLNDWACLVDHESSRNSGVRGGPNSDGSYDYGLFQINDRYWCGVNGPAKDCGIACSSLLNDDIADDVGCVRKIYSIHGFSAWYGWVNYCQGAKPDVVRNCFGKDVDNNNQI